VGLLDRSPSRPRIALRRSSAVPARCLESVSTTDVHVTSTRWKHPFRRLPVERRGKPADVRLRDRSSFFGFRLDVRAAPDHLAVIRPPTATRLTACLPASGLSATFFLTTFLAVSRGRHWGHGVPGVASFRAGGEAPGRFLPKPPLPTRPSDTSHRRPDRDPRCLKARLFSRRLTPLPPEHVNAADFHRVEVPSIVGDRRRSAFEPRRGVLVPAGRPGQAPHVFIVVLGPRLDPCSYALRVRLQGRVRFHDFCNRCFHEHDHGPLRTSRRPKQSLGRLPFSSKVAFRPATARASRGQGSRYTAPRRSPPGLLPAETSPRPRSLRAPRVARTALLPVRSDGGEERNRQRGAHLHGARSERVVRRPTSAKRRDVHQPEGPSIGRPRASRAGVW
jgi:hypothetical protein